jgi:hypothetical protein
MKTRLFAFFIFYFLIFNLGSTLRAQTVVKDSSITVPMFQISVGVHSPGGDLKSRFGNFATLGGGFSIKTKKNYILGTEGYFQFGGDVKELEVLDFLRNGNNQIINLGGRYANVVYFQRGGNFTFTFGKVFPILGPNPNCGLRTTVGLGYWQHKIKIVDKEGGVFFLRDEYLAGFDRKTGGFVLNEFIGYNHQSNNRIINFTAGFEFSQGFTQNLRDYDFATKQKDVQNRTDLSYGLRVSWFIPLYKKSPQEFYFY